MTHPEYTVQGLLPCPFCGGPASVGRIGTQRQSCIISCDNCGATVESGEVGPHCGTAWNRRQLTAATPAPAAAGDAVRALVAKWRKTAFGLGADGRKAADRCADELEAALATKEESTAK